MRDKLEQLSERLNELEKLMSMPDALGDQQKYQSYAKEHASLSVTIQRYELFKKTSHELDEALKLVKDPNQDKEFTTFLESEILHLQKRTDELEIQIKADLLPVDKNEGRNIIMEIRA
ncbi:MAG: PCRF domain-containing protein, partial [Chlamydiota bacterium]|nr:PCRF domain-containing protein [Chlamydiota bacterium]